MLPYSKNLEEISHSEKKAPIPLLDMYPIRRKNAYRLRNSMAQIVEAMLNRSIMLYEKNDFSPNVWKKVQAQYQNFVSPSFLSAKDLVEFAELMAEKMFFFEALDSVLLEKNIDDSLRLQLLPHEVKVLDEYILTPPGPLIEVESLLNDIFETDIFNSPPLAIGATDLEKYFRRLSGLRPIQVSTFPQEVGAQLLEIAGKILLHENNPPQNRAPLELIILHNVFKERRLTLHNKYLAITRKKINLLNYIDKNNLENSFARKDQGFENSIAEAMQEMSDWINSRTIQSQLPQMMQSNSPERAQFQKEYAAKKKYLLKVMAQQKNYMTMNPSMRKKKFSYDLPEVFRERNSAMLENLDNIFAMMENFEQIFYARLPLTGPHSLFPDFSLKLERLKRAEFHDHLVKIGLITGAGVFSAAAPYYFGEHSDP